MVKSFLGNPDVQKKYIEDNRLPLVISAKDFWELISKKEKVNNEEEETFLEEQVLGETINKYIKKYALLRDSNLKIEKFDFFIDGLDEVRPSIRQKFILKYIEKHGFNFQHRFIALTRITNEAEKPRHSNYFQIIQIKNLAKREDKNKFINNYLVDFIYPEDKIHAFQKRLKDFPVLDNLCNTPAMLAHLCIAFKNKVKRNPNMKVDEIFTEWTLAEIFRGSFEHILVKREDAQENYQRFDILKEHQDIFEMLAYRSFKENLSNDLKTIPHQIFDKVLANYKLKKEQKKLLKQEILDSNIVCCNSEGNYEFSLLTYKDFFLAEYLSRKDQEKKEKIPEYRNGEIEIFNLREENRDFFYDNSFYQTLKFYVSMLPSKEAAKSFLERLAFVKDVSLDFSSEREQMGGNLADKTNHKGLITAINLEEYSPFLKKELLLMNEIQDLINISKNPFEKIKELLSSISPVSQNYLTTLVDHYLYQEDNYQFLNEKEELIKLLLFKLGSAGFHVVENYLKQITPAGLDIQDLLSSKEDNTALYLFKINQTKIINFQEHKVKILKFLLHNYPKEGLLLAQDLLSEDDSNENNHLKISIVKIVLRYLPLEDSKEVLSVFLNTSNKKSQKSAINYAIKVWGKEKLGEVIYFIAQYSTEGVFVKDFVYYALDYLQKDASELVKIFLKSKEYNNIIKMEVIEYALPYLRKETLPLLKLFLEENANNQSLQIQSIKKVFLGLQDDMLDFLDEFVRSDSYSDNVKYRVMKTVAYELKSRSCNIMNECRSQMKYYSTRERLSHYFDKYCKDNKEKNDVIEFKKDDITDKNVESSDIQAFCLELKELESTEKKIKIIKAGLKQFQEKVLEFVHLEDFDNAEDKIVIIKIILKCLRNKSLDFVEKELKQLEEDSYNKRRVLECVLKYLGEDGVEWIKLFLPKLKEEERGQILAYTTRVFGDKSLELILCFLIGDYSDEEKLAFVKKVAFYLSNKSPEKFNGHFLLIVSLFLQNAKNKEITVIRILKFIVYILKENSFAIIKNFIFDETLEEKVKTKVIQSAIYYLKEKSSPLVEPILQSPDFTLKNKTEILKSAFKHMQEEAFPLFKCFFENLENSPEELDAKTKVANNACLYLINSKKFTQYALNEGGLKHLSFKEKEQVETDLLTCLSQADPTLEIIQKCLNQYHFNFSIDNFKMIWKEKKASEDKYCFYLEINDCLNETIFNKLADLDLDTRKLQCKLEHLRVFLEEDFKKSVEFWFVKNESQGNIEKIRNKDNFDEYFEIEEVNENNAAVIEEFYPILKSRLGFNPKKSPDYRDRYFENIRMAGHTKGILVRNKENKAVVAGIIGVVSQGEFYMDFISSHNKVAGFGLGTEALKRMLYEKMPKWDAQELACSVNPLTDESRFYFHNFGATCDKIILFDQKITNDIEYYGGIKTYRFRPKLTANKHLNRQGEELKDAVMHGENIFNLKDTKEMLASYLEKKSNVEIVVLKLSRSKEKLAKLQKTPEGRRKLKQLKNEVVAFHTNGEFLFEKGYEIIDCQLLDDNHHGFVFAKKALNRSPNEIKNS